MKTAVFKILEIKEGEKIMSNNREPLVLNFWGNFVSHCENIGKTPEEVCNELKLQLEVVKLLYTTDDRNNFSILKTISNYFDEIPDDMLDLYLVLDDYNSARALLKEYCDKANPSFEVIQARFGNIHSFRSWFINKTHYLDKRITDVADFVGLPVNTLIGRPRPLDSEGVYNNRNVAAYETNRDKSTGNKDIKRNVK